MARTVATNFTGSLQFPYATAATDLFKKEDVQTLALAVDGHDHTAGKGLALKATDIADWFRSTGHTTAFPATGTGLEMYYDAGTGGNVQTYNRGGATYAPLTLRGSTLALAIGSTSAISIDASRNVSVNGALTVTGAATAVFTGAVTMQATASFQTNIGVTGDISMGASSRLLFPTGGLIADGASGYVSVSKLTVTPGAAAFSSVAFNGPITTGANFAGSISAGAPASAPAGAIALGNGIGQGNGAASTLPLAKGTGFGPTSGTGTGWVQLNTGGTMIYVPYFT